METERDQINRLTGEVERLEKALAKTTVDLCEVKERLSDAQDSIRGRQEWLYKWKSRLGYMQSTSFDRVMEDLIAGKHLEGNK